MFPDFMKAQSSGGLGLPSFQHNDKQQQWVASERRTANLIRSLWKGAGEQQRNDPAFLCLLVQCGWTNAGHKSGGESIRLWRNRNIADYLKAPYASDEQLARSLQAHFRSMSFSKYLSMLGDRTGIALYRNTYRSATLKFLKRHTGKVARAFEQVSTASANVDDKIRRVATLIESLGKISAAGRHVSPFNGLTPALSCLDPQHKFPIMNQRTRRLLRSIGMKADGQGVVALSKLIGPTYDIKDARELDVYASTEKFPKPKRHIGNNGSADGFKDVGLKSEINSFAQITAKKTVITKLHNKLINDFRTYLLWRYNIAPKEDRFDALVFDWKKGRDLLIEAKTASEGASGRAQIRQAIGQLYDYRFTFMATNNVDLAVLLLKEPTAHVKNLLASLGIELLWFKGKGLLGTISL
jgi:hypothetical protein